MGGNSHSVGHDSMTKHLFMAGSPLELNGF